MNTHHALCSLPNFQCSHNNDNNKWAEQVRNKNDIRKVCTVLVAKPELKKLLGEPKLNLKDNIKMDLKETHSPQRESRY